MSVAQWLLLPVFIHLGLLMYLGRGLALARGNALKAGIVKADEAASDNSRWPDEARKFANCFQNQFEVPVLFYALLPLLLILAFADWVQVVLAWCFMACRLLHAYLHTGRNDMRQRFKPFVLSIIFLYAMWGWFALRFYVIG